MKELQFIDIIKNQLSDNSFIGDDCAYLKDLGVFITQDTLYENVHFSMNTTTPYLLGRKSVSVNLSDIASALAKPLYISISLSMPKNIKENFVKELYRGINDVCSEFGIKVTGGDITGGEKIVISICAIGKKMSNFITSRSYAKKDDCIVVTGNFGASAAGFHALSNYLYADEKLINAHLNPVPRIKEAICVSSIINSNVALMDCSDGLIDALYKISIASKHSVEIDINKVNVLNEVQDYCKSNNLDYKELAKWGAEDYELMLCINEDTFNLLDKSMFKFIGRVKNYSATPEIIVQDGEQTQVITKEIFENNVFNHF